MCYSVVFISIESMDNIQQSFFFNITSYLLPFCKNYAKEDILLFNKAIHNYNDHVIIFDQIIDGDVDYVKQYIKRESYFSAYHHKYKQSLFLLLKLFPSESEFWNLLEENEKNYYDTLIHEKFINTERPAMSSKDFETMAIGKHALAFVPVKGMEILCNIRFPKEAITIYEKIFCAMQMLDDIEDFEKDRKNSQWNYLHSLVNEFVKDNEINMREFGDDFYLRVFYASNIAEKQTNYAMDKFGEALTLSKAMQLKSLTDWLGNSIDQVRGNLSIIREIVA